MGLGVISVTMENGEQWLYDSGWLTWLLKSNCKMEIKKFVFPGADGIDEYLQIKLSDGREYIFDRSYSSILELTDTFDFHDYRTASATVSTVSDIYNSPSSFGNSEWTLKKGPNGKPIVTGCDRISLMYKE